MTVADPAGDAPAAGDRDGLPRRGFRRLAEQGPGLLEGPVPSQSPCLQPLTPVRAHLRQAMTSSSYAGNPRFGYFCSATIWGSWPVLVNQYSGPIFWGMELLSCLLPDSTSLHPVSWHLDPHLDPDQATAALSLISQQPAPECPLCHVAARRLHSRYERADLPWAGWTVRLELGVRKLFCDNPDCGRRIFTERLPGVVAPWARRTLRLGKRLPTVAVALGGSAGARLSRDLGIPVSRNTLLRLIRAAPLPVCPTPTVLGVDDWAFRKGQTYGTVLIDLERRQRVTLLPDREADTLATWLEEHPGVEIVARDRSGAYAEGARRGAPQAEQVADRFHLVQNLAAVLETVFTAHAAELRTVEQEGPDVGSEQAVRPGPPHREAPKRAKADERRERRLAKFQQVWVLHRIGWTGEAIARHLGLSRRTVVRYLRHETFPERRGRSDAGRSRLDPWKPIILERWNAGCRHSRRLFRQIQGHGYRGSYPTLARYTQRLRQAQEGAAGRAAAAACRRIHIDSRSRPAPRRGWYCGTLKISPPRKPTS